MQRHVELSKTPSDVNSPCVENVKNDDEDNNYDDDNDDDNNYDDDNDEDYKGIDDEDKDNNDNDVDDDDGGGKCAMRSWRKTIHACYAGAGFI